MTEKEAIAYLRNTPLMRFEDGGVHSSLGDAMRMAVKALERMMPKKPLIEKEECFIKSKDGAEGYFIVYVCPACGSKKLIRSYPCRCGQHIDWGE